MHGSSRSAVSMQGNCEYESYLKDSSCQNTSQRADDSMGIIKHSSEYSGYNYYEQILLGSSNGILIRSETPSLKKFPSI